MNLRRWIRSGYQTIAIATAVTLAGPLAAQSNQTPALPALQGIPLQLMLSADGPGAAVLFVTEQEPSGLIRGFIRRAEGDTPVWGAIGRGVPQNSAGSQSYSFSFGGGSQGGVVFGGSPQGGSASGIGISFRETVAPGQERRYTGAIHRTEGSAFIAGTWQEVRPHVLWFFGFSFVVSEYEGPFPFAAAGAIPPP